MMNELYHMLEDGVISAEEQELIEAEAKCNPSIDTSDELSALPKR